MLSGLDKMIVRSFLWLICLLVWRNVANAQSDTTYSYNDHRLLGVKASIGAASAPTGWLGITLFGGQKHLEYHLSVARSNVIRYAIGVNALGNAQSRWTWCSGLNFLHATTKVFTFDHDGIAPREYRVSNGQFILADVGVMRRTKGYLKRDCRNFVLSVGYQWRISDYTIASIGSGLPKQDEIDRMAYDLFKSRWYWTLSFRFGEFWPKRVKTPA